MSVTYKAQAEAPSTYRGFSGCLIPQDFPVWFDSDGKGAP